MRSARSRRSLTGAAGSAAVTLAGAVAAVTLAGAVAAGSGCPSEPVAPLRCEAPSREIAGRCVGTVCGEGTVEDDGVCVPLCGAGTALTEEGGCAVAVECGPDTHAEGNQCVPDDPGGGGDVACGAGTVLSADGSECLATLACGAGTVLSADGSECIATLACGAGTVLSPGGDACIATLTCGLGTIENVDGECVPVPVVANALYDVRIPSTVEALAFPVSIFAFGRTEDDQPLTGVDVVFRLSRPDAGVIPDPTHALGLFGVTTTYQPCLEGDAGCLGPAVLELLVDGVVVANAPFEIVAPAGVGDPTPCLGGGDALYLNGPAGDFIHPGEDTITAGSFSASITAAATVSIDVDPANPNEQGLFWFLDFDAPDGQTLAETVYLDATRFPFNSTGPGLSISGDGRGCNQLSGSFEVHELTLDGAQLAAFTATWLQSCDGGPLMAGCIHIEQP